MNRILQTGRTGLDSIQRKMDTIAHNISNVQTVGYKSLGAEFADLVYDTVANRGTPMTLDAREKPIEIGTGSRIKSIMHKFEQGALEETSNTFDLAIVGEGFFGVESENGELYLTRNGAFSLDSNGDLVDSLGNHVSMDIYSPISQWSADDISIDERGILTGSDGTGQRVEIGRLCLYHVMDKAALTSVGDTYFTSGFQDNIVLLDNNVMEDKIRQGFLERSSVDIAKELTDMFITQRAYQINTKSIHAADEMWSMINQLKR
jgi:flagellar basal-body rod protein FlgG